MANEIVMYERAEQAVVVPKRGDYTISVGKFPSVTLKRDVDFGVIPKTKQPSLFKAGAEKVCMAYGLMKRFTVESAIEQGGKEPFFFYRVRCDLYKLDQNGVEHIISNGHGSANTAERRNGFNGPYDAANSSLKMAEKRSLVAACISLANLSDLFSQDMENETFMSKADETVKMKDDSPVTTAQMRRLYAIGGQAGLTNKEIKDRIIAAGYASTKDIRQKDYEKVCALFDKKD